MDDTSMKELNTQKPLVLGLIGLPGAGKSKLAQQFSTMFGAPVIDAGLLRRTVFGDRIPNKQYELGLRAAFWSLADELFKTKRTFLLDGNLNSFAARSEARAAAKKAGYDVLWLWVQTSEAVARDRATAAKRGSENIIIPTAAFDRAVTLFEAPRAGEEHVVLSGQRTFNSQVRPILKKIAEGHEAKLQPPRPSDRPARRSIFIR